MPVVFVSAAVIGVRAFSQGDIANAWSPSANRPDAVVLTKHKDLQLVLSVGDRVEPDHIGPAPNNAIIVKRAPQLELLKRTSVCVTHAGLNTVLESLAQGVPQVAIPVTRTAIAAARAKSGR